MSFLPLVALPHTLLEPNAPLIQKLGSEASAGWQTPVNGPLERPYLQPSSDYSAGHRGVDYRVTLGQPVFAAATGVVSYAGRLVNRNLISIKHGVSILSEVEPVCPVVTVGEKVFGGQQIGKVCQPDANYRQHCNQILCLHFSLRRESLYLSPLVFIGGLNPSRLLPIG